MWLSDRFPGLMLWHTVAVLAAVFAAKALLYWAADWLGSFAGGGGILR